MDGGAGSDGFFGNNGIDTADYSNRWDALIITQDELSNDGKAGEYDNVARNYKIYLASATTLARKDWARSQIADAYQQSGDFKEALHYLKEKKVPVNQTAYLVGFSEPAAFSRAFKRWTGSSPRIYISRSESST